jgi:hypothetical protein
MLKIIKMDTGCHARWLLFLSVEACFGARKQDLENFLPLKQGKTGQKIAIITLIPICTFYSFSSFI